MGVPALFRWLSTKYPKITAKVIEDLPADNEGTNDLSDYDFYKKFDFSTPNPCGFEVDNLYLDMNGIVHPCCHPEGKQAPSCEEDMMTEIGLYIDRIMTMIRPRKLLYMAVDGVAPRAKMNQQRSRRFKASLDAKAKQLEAEKNDAAADADFDGNESAASNEEAGDVSSSATAAPFDSNCITPGTPFMQKLTAFLREYVVHRLQSNPSWAPIKVILSDSSVPGEGEHKIMDFIRTQRLSSEYNPNQSHVIYGLDADLIMLTLATHEPRFKILREDVFFEESRRYNICMLCGTKGHFSDDCAKATDKKKPCLVSDKPFIFLDIAVLREYLQLEFMLDGELPRSADFERLIDDWVFLCFFIGNDFLPHLPSLDIREGAIDMLVEIYKKNFVKMGGYVTRDGHVYLDRMQVIVDELGRMEEFIFTKRKEIEERKMAAKMRREREAKEQDTNDDYTLQRFLDMPKLSSDSKSSLASNDNSMTDDASIVVQPPVADENQVSERQKSPMIAESDVADSVRMWEPGAKDRYYQSKLHFSSDAKDCINQLIKAYTEGLCWVAAYYYQGCVSWKWFYPFHYAPFASDFADAIHHLNITFDRGAPFRPYDQLMSVLPSSSRYLIPSAFHGLMTEPLSEIYDFYPEEFPIDLNGKKHSWQGVVLLPFIEENRLLKALETVYPNLSEDEIKRNERGIDLLFMQQPTIKDASKDIQETATQTISGLNGTVHCLPEDAGFPVDVSVMSFESFALGEGKKYPAKLLPGVEPVPNVLEDEDKECIGKSTSSFRQPNGNGRTNMQFYHNRPSATHSQSRERFTRTPFSRRGRY